MSSRGAVQEAGIADTACDQARLEADDQYRQRSFGTQAINHHRTFQDRSAIERGDRKQERSSKGEAEVDLLWFVIPTLLES